MLHLLVDHFKIGIDHDSPSGIHNEKLSRNPEFRLPDCIQNRLPVQMNLHQSDVPHGIKILQHSSNRQNQVRIDAASAEMVILKALPNQLSVFSFGFLHPFQIC
ncbi:hypothetical protein D3C81_1907790 [compost metagenome]